MKITLSFFALLLSVSFIAQTNYTVNGNLGVGEAPTHKLSVAGDSKMTGELTVTEKTKLEADVEVEGELKLVNLSTTGDGYERLLYLDENGNIKKMTDEEFNKLLNQMYAKECDPTITSWMPVWNNDIDQLYVHSNCEVDLMVGIGLPNPTARLELSGIENGYQFKINGFTSSKAFTITNNGNDNFTILGNGTMSINNQLASLKAISISSNTNANVFEVLGTGQLSILKQAPDYTAFKIQDELDNDVFRVMGNGLVIATEVKVRLKEEFDFPDYVFEDDYELMTLEELKAFIKTNKRLPNMPSAQKVAAEGLDLGENDRLLTEKVEELTLYVLQLKEELDKLKAQNQAIQLQLAK